ncbi:response regulator transcription factor [Pseudomonas edaphica]|uniref:Response regulator transcription factor n=1 Tax=Pseudomonas edaphica TaxID=2006980 RepID=A0A7Y7RQU3_9PSED|nr:MULTISPECIES: response regulator transcription factor [Pseudomonas]NMX56264.1 response regulator transcription factor [Pseudomonas sp. WS 5146]NVZ55850.1 response regulator transcription factor [Pseudomonas edaphica]
MFKVVVIDGQPLVRAAIKVVLRQNDFAWVAEADNGADGLELVHEHSPDLVILDIHLSRVSGLEVMEKIYSFDKNIEILVLTSYSARHYYNRCRAARASAFLPKTCTIEELERTVNVLMMGGACVPDSVDRLPAAGSSFANEALLINSLSNRELMTFELLIRGMSNKEIASYLQLSNKTISTYKTRLLEKLNVFSLVHLFEFAKRNGLVG